MPRLRQNDWKRSGTPTGRSATSWPEPTANPAAGHGDAKGLREVIASAAGIDARRAAEFAHPHDQRLVESTALLQIAQELGHRLIELGGEVAAALEVVVVCVPAIQADFDERNARLDQSPSQQTRRAKLGATIGVADCRWFALQVEGLHLRAGDHAGRRLVQLAVTLDFANQSGRAARLLQPRQQIESPAKSRGGGRQLRIVGKFIRLLHRERVVLRSQKPATTRARAIADRHEARQLTGGVRQLVRGDCSERRVLDAWRRHVAGMHQEHRSGVVPLLGVHRADDRQVVHHSRQLRQIVGDLDAGNRRVDGSRLAAVLVVGLGIERLELARAAAHEQQDARHALAADFVGAERKQVAQRQHSAGQRGGRDGTQKLAARTNQAAGHANARQMVKSREHGEPASKFDEPFAAALGRAARPRFKVEA
jgi:hypothetical protein